MPSFSSGLSVGFPCPSRSVCVAGCAYLLWSEGEDYQAELRHVTAQHAKFTFSMPPQEQGMHCIVCILGTRALAGTHLQRPGLGDLGPSAEHSGVRGCAIDKHTDQTSLITC